MSATKAALEVCIEKLIEDQELDIASDDYTAIWQLVGEGIIAPLDYTGERWQRDGIVFSSTDKELFADAAK